MRPRAIASAGDLAEHRPMPRRPPQTDGNSRLRIASIMNSPAHSLAATLLALALAAPLTATAQSRIPSLDRNDHLGEVGRAARQKAIERFDSADADKDGKLSREEVAGRFTYQSENFDQNDKNRDGFLDWEEFIGHDRWKKE